MDESAYRLAVQHIRSLDKRYKANKAVGWVYILRNSAFKKPLLKIGMTKNPPFQRAHEISRATGVPGEFELVYFVHVSDRAVAESWVHKRLHRYRATAWKEFFEAPVSVALGALDEVAEQFPLLLGNWPLPQAFPWIVSTCENCGAKNRIRSLAVQAFIPRCGKCGRKVLLRESNG